MYIHIFIGVYIYSKWHKSDHLEKSQKPPCYACVPKSDQIRPHARNPFLRTICEKRKNA